MVESLSRPSSPHPSSAASTDLTSVDLNTPLVRIKPKGAVISILGADLKQDIREHLEDGTFSGIMEDHLARPLIVGAQADIETAALKLEAHHKPIYVIHTKEPATPLRKIELGKIDPQILAHTESMQTIPKRDVSMRNLLEKGIVQIYNLYETDSGLSDDEKANFNANVEKYPNLHAIQILKPLKDFGAPIGAVFMARHNDDVKNSDIMMVDASQVTKRTNQWGFNFSDIQTISENGQQMLDSRMPLLRTYNIPISDHLSL